MEQGKTTLKTGPKIVNIAKKKITKKSQYKLIFTVRRETDPSNNF